MITIMKKTSAKELIKLNAPPPIRSIELGELKPIDEYQVCAFDTLMNNQFSILLGKPGSGKTLLSLSYAISQVSSLNYNKLVIIFNPVKVRGSQEMGYYTGSKLEKSLQENIGGILTGKLGGEEAVREMLERGLLELVPASDIRGIEFSNKTICYVTEAQNMSIDLAKLLIQRVGEDSKLIMEGDTDCQVDDYLFEGERNGLRRAIDVFKNNEKFGYVHLSQVHRSWMAELAENM